MGSQVVPTNDEERPSTETFLRKPRCSCTYRPVLCLAFVAVFAASAAALTIWQPWRGQYAPDQPARLLIPSVFPNSTTVYLGNGCFWERQYAYVNIELECNFSPPATASACSPFHRSPDNITSKAGYGGGLHAGLACYDTYEDMGYTEVTSVELEEGLELEQFSALLVDYFGSFVSTSGGMSRPDPGDKGPAYRSLLAFPGGVKSSWFPIVQQLNVHGMQLKEAIGGERDQFNTVWVMDSSKMLFVRAEQYHQLHSNFAGPRYPESYVYELWLRLIHRNAIPPTGCSEAKHW